MASRTEGDKKWKKRRLALAKTEKMRATKQPRVEASAPVSPIANLTSRTHPSPETPQSSTQPGPSGLQQDISVTPTTEILTDEGDSSSSESDFDDETATDFKMI